MNTISESVGSAMKISESILNLVPYKPGKPISEAQREYGLDKVYKLASNENPLGPSQKVLNAIEQAAKEIHRYPDPGCFLLKQEFAKYYSVESKSLVFGNGSNELIDLLIRIFCEPGDKVLTSEGSFIAYKVCATASRVQVIETPLTEGLTFDVQALIEAYKKHKPQLIFIANPNNPTGTYLNKSEVDALMSAVGNDPECLVVFDEAYNEFVRAEDYPNSLNYFKDYTNVVVLRTFSKIFGLAGLRVGAMVANDEVVDLVNRVRNPFNVNSLAQAAAIAVLHDQEYVQRVQENNWKGLDYFYQQFESLGVKYWKSETNFVLFDTKQDSAQVNEELLKQGVIMRPVKPYGLSTHLRLSVGTVEENQAAIKALKNTF